MIIVLLKDVLGSYHLPTLYRHPWAKGNNSQRRSDILTLRSLVSICLALLMRTGKGDWNYIIKNYQVVALSRNFSSASNRRTI